MDNNNENNPKQQPPDQSVNPESTQEQQFDRYQHDAIPDESGSPQTPMRQGNHFEDYPASSHAQPPVELPGSGAQAAQPPMFPGQPPQYAPPGQPPMGPGQPPQYAPPGQPPMGPGQPQQYAPPSQPGQPPMGPGQPQQYAPPSQPGQPPMGYGQQQYIPSGHMPQAGYAGAPPPKNNKKRNRIIIIIIAAVLVLAVAAAVALYFFTCIFGNHSFAAADCNHPETCTRCGMTQGDALGHKWEDANCQHPKRCSVCGETIGTKTDHQWVEATCEKPKTCALCGATEGEPSGHIWVDGDCQTPGHCIICNKQNQEYGDHDWLEANYQSAKTCALCGAVEGERLMPSFVFYNLYDTQIYVGNSAFISTVCNDNNDYQTMGMVYVADNYTADKVEGYEALEGYEWLITEFVFEFSDENAYDYGVEMTWDYYDYYDQDLFNDTRSIINNVDSSHSVNYQGELWHDCIIKQTEISDEWIDNSYILKLVIAMRVPVGYDGAMVGFINTGMPVEDEVLNEIIAFDTVFFRHGGDIPREELPSQ